MKNEVGIIYYSSNKEKVEFETKIVDSLLKNCGDLPIVSVSQKPMDLGKNICVGDTIGVSGYNMFRQVLIGLKEMDTKFVLSAEADCVYPPDYFTFVPDKDNVCYRNSNLYVMGDRRNYWFYKKEGATHSQIIGREFYISVLEKLFKDLPMWSPDEKNFPKERTGQNDVFEEKDIEFYRTENPVFQIKTHLGMRYYTHSERVPIYELPYWGKGSDIKRYYCG